MKRILFVITLILSGFSLLTGQDGLDIMRRVDEAPSPRTTHALILMELTDHRGVENERTVEQWSAEDSRGNNHSVMVFHTPATVKNTRFLARENEDRDDDQWIFLPSLNRVRRIASSEEDGSFMGTEFTYYDMRARVLDDYEYRYLAREEVLGWDCYKVEIRPRAQTDSIYEKTISWVTVDEEINTVVKIEIYKSETELLKILTVEELSLVSGYWTPLRVTMTNIQNGRSTSLIQQRLELDKAVNTGRFSQRFLETGRTQ